MSVDDTSVLAEGLTVLKNPAQADIDIVFIHGLGGHPFKTWSCEPKTVSPPPASRKPRARRKRSSFFCCGDDDTDEDDNSYIDSDAPVRGKPSRVFWPKDFLAEESHCHNARILTYGYDSKVTKGYSNANKNSLFAHSRDLLYALQREKPPRRAVVFVVHSLSSLLVKETLRRSEASEEVEMRDIVQSTRGIVFFGTPHRGSAELAELGEMVRSIASSVLAVDSNSTLLRTLGSDSPELELGRESFLVLWRQYNFRVKTFQEAWGMSGINVGALNKKVVPDISSMLDDPREHAETISANHRDMCKFDRRTDPGYAKVSAELRTIILSSRSSPVISSEGQDFLRSLHFPEMYQRQRNIQRALDDTCDWLYETPEYASWINRSRASDHQGLLWVKGKPGTGKSTLMKDALRRAETKLAASQTTTAGFFFNARGTEQLEKTPIGLYRSILHQVLQQDVLALSYLIPVFNKKKILQEVVTWHQEELQDILTHVFATTHSRPAVVFLDAMDECNDDEVRDLVRFFRDLTRKATKAGASLSICFSSRHYPHISIDDCPEVVVEHHNQQDIIRYIRSQSEDLKMLRELGEEIVDRSSGVFLWVVLTMVVLKKRGRGKSLKWMRQKLQESPPELETLFRTLVNHTDAHEAERARILIQMILFASRPLTLSEISLVLGFARHQYKTISEWNDSVEYLPTPEIGHEMIIDTSRGLLEVTMASLGLPVEDRTYQFIHETVRTFYLSGQGLNLLQFDSTRLAAGHSHMMLATACVNLLQLAEFDGDQSIVSMLPETSLLDYVTEYLFEHIDKAEENGVPQDKVLVVMEQEGCELLRRLVRLRPRCKYELGSTLLTAAILHDTVYVLKRLLAMGRSPNQPSNTSLRYPLHHALMRDEKSKSPDVQLDMVELLLQNGADVSLRNAFKQTPLHIAAAKTVRLVTAVLAHRPFLNAKDYEGETPLHRACRCGVAGELDGIVKLLVDAGADRRVKDNKGMTPLDTLRSKNIGTKNYFQYSFNEAFIKTVVELLEKE
ncbi:hypothetical protein B0T10DRAFT_469156 [Thelonectria olida]|uniref:Nephrocystin 3-like N-terminal domain-containing protein n=1 Tax=Thelonectria olida TaxID=1576542 RepID=A0A9P8WHW9_9HYPO|nr:hypothetical protein B0T10DRAFT_469156 [Thelonectria olida]